MNVKHKMALVSLESSRLLVRDPLARGNSRDRCSVDSNERSRKASFGAYPADYPKSSEAPDGWMAHPRLEGVMPWRNPMSYPFDKSSVSLNAPMRSGVYALYNKATWVYVGETENILAQLIQHLSGDNTCIILYPNLTFSFELVPEGARAWRQEELIREFRPVCNPKLN